MWILVVYGVLVLSVPGYPTNYKFTVDTEATLTSVAASHFFRGYFNSLPVNKQNIISSSLIILSYVTEYQVCRSYIAAIVLNFLPDKASFLLSEYPTICWLTIGFRPIASVLVLSIFLVVASRLFLHLLPGEFKGIESLSRNKIFYSLYLCNLMVFSFDISNVHYLI